MISDSNSLSEYQKIDKQKLRSVISRYKNKSIDSNASIENKTKFGIAPKQQKVINDTE